MKFLFYCFLPGESSSYHMTEIVKGKWGTFYEEFSFLPSIVVLV